MRCTLCTRCYHNTRIILLAPLKTVHGLPHTENDFQAPSRGDVLRVILTELDGVPHLGNDELKDARDRAITLVLTNRFANVRGKMLSLFPVPK